jgi:hypothetical protein
MARISDLVKERQGRGEVEVGMEGIGEEGKGGE